MAYSYFGDIIGKCLPGMVFKIAGEGGDAHIQLLCYFFNINFVLVVFQNELKDHVDLVRIIGVAGGKYPG